HPDVMAGVVNVVASGQPPLSPATVSAAGDAQFAALTARGRQLSTAPAAGATGPGGTGPFTVITGPAEGQVQLFRFAPSNLTVPVGSKVVFDASGTIDLHTVSGNIPPEILAGPPPDA